jgi:regulator of protease activity HflC (stomatin/prohibitin superfamily)
MIILIILAVLVIAFIVVMAFNVFIVPQAYLYVIERLGKYYKTSDAGLHIKIPFIDRIVNKVTSKEQVLDTPPQPVITSDNVTLHIDSVTYFSVFNAALYTYGAVEPMLALSNLASTTLRNVIGEMTLDESLTSRDTINVKLTDILDKATDKWGIKVHRVEIKNIIPPEEIRKAMEKQMKAERDKRQTMLEAEAHKEAVITRAEGDKTALVLEAEGERDAMIARAEGEAKATILAKEAEAAGLKELLDAGIDDKVLALKRYEALIALADGQAAKLIIPTDVVDMTTANTVFAETTGLGNQTKQGIRNVKLTKHD